jgi:plasmid stability protein
MDTEKKIQLNLSIPEHYRNILRKMAAEHNYKNPMQVASATSVGTGIFLEAMRMIEESRTRKENNHDNA